MPNHDRRLRSREGAKIFSTYAVGIGKKPLRYLLPELDLARERALEIANKGDADEKEEVEKRYLEQRLFTICESDSSVLDILRAMVAICERESFDQERRNHILKLGLPFLEWRLKRGES